MFEFGDLTAGEVMVPRVRVAGLPRDASVDALRDVLHAAAHTRYPVYAGTIDRIVGVVHVKDILRALLAGESLARMALRPAPFVPATSSVDQVLAAMSEARSQLAVILDEHGGTAGIVTVEDLFEEVVGEFGEDPGARPELYRDDAGRLRVRGDVRLDDVGAELEVSLEHEDVDTTGGLVLALLGRPPRVGDSVRYRRARFDVTAVEGRGVKEAIVTLLPAPPDEESPAED